MKEKLKFKKRFHSVFIETEWVRFVVIFAIIMLPLYIAYYYAQQGGYLHFVKSITAQITAKFLYLTGVNVQLLRQAPFYGDAFIYGNFMPIRVIYECTGIFMMIIFISGIFAYKSSWLEKLIGFAVCIPGIYLTNIIRLIFLALIGHHFPQFFDFFHNYVWYALFSIILIGMWLFWIDIVVSQEN